LRYFLRFFYVSDAPRVPLSFPTRRSSDLVGVGVNTGTVVAGAIGGGGRLNFSVIGDAVNIAARIEAATRELEADVLITAETAERDRKSTRLNSSHVKISYAVFCLKKKRRR